MVQVLTEDLVLADDVCPRMSDGQRIGEGDGGQRIREGDGGQRIREGDGGQQIREGDEEEGEAEGGGQHHFICNEKHYLTNIEMLLLITACLVN